MGRYYARGPQSDRYLARSERSGEHPHHCTGPANTETAAAEEGRPPRRCTWRRRRRRDVNHDQLGGGGAMSVPGEHMSLHEWPRTKRC